MAQPLNAEVGEIVTRVVGGMSLEQAAFRLDYRLSKEAIRHLKSGKVGREETIRTFAEGFWERLCEEYGGQIGEQFGSCSREHASDWLAVRAGFGLRYSRPGAGAEQTYEADWDGFDPRFLGGTEGLTPEDIAEVKAVVQALVAEKRRRRGLD